VIGELSAELYGLNPDGSIKADTVYFAQLMSGIGAALAGQDVNIASLAGANAAQNNYRSHSPFREVKSVVNRENARLTAECGLNCTQEQMRSIDLQVQKVEAAANLIAISQRSTLTTEKAIELAETLAGLMPLYGTPIALYQAVTGESLTGRDLSSVERWFNGIAAAIPAGTLAYKTITAAVSEAKLIATTGAVNLGDDTRFLLSERQLKTGRANLTGAAELPPKNASSDMVRAIQRQNEAAETLANHGINVERLPNTGRFGANPDLRINGELADVYAPTSGNVLSIRDKIVEKVGTQASNVVISLADSILTPTQIGQYLQKNPVPGMKNIILIKEGKVIVIGE
jgi:hypothetical protein